MTRDELPPFTSAGSPPKILHPDAWIKPEPYVPAPELVTAIQLAMHLKRPLLLEGEPGCGKTRLAYALAYQLGLPLELWPIGSGAKASDGLYRYDAVLRLHDVQIARNAPKFTEKTERNPANVEDYVELGPIGRAFMREGTPSVILIDEIDKADVDFANDLLTVIDRDGFFNVPEVPGRQIGAKEGYEPIFIITSNREKGNLPDPFLRRCIYHFVRFPDEVELKEIVKRHYALTKKKAPKKQAEALSRFMPLRKGLEKPPGTSEFLDWLNVLDTFKGDAQSDKLWEDGGTPYLPVLVKLASDVKRITQPST